jgi:purine nucleosidase/pyrimidine-specific ribonucleoside hydrolase
MRHKVIIDTDIGDDIDDVIAISFAVRRPELDVVAITTCFGPTAKRGRLLAKQLSLLGRDDIPYAPGPRLPMTPVSDERRRTLETNSPFEYDFVGDDEQVRPPASDDAVEFLYETICRHAGDVTLVTIGPLTNIGLLFQRHPDAADKLKCIAMMAGNFPIVPPLVRNEYNMRADYVASKIALGTKTPKFLGTWEITQRVVMLEPELAALRAGKDPAIAGIVRQIDLWWAYKGEKKGPVIYDMCPILWRFDPSCFTTRKYRIDVLTDGPEAGKNVESPSATPIDVSMGIREADVLRLLMDTLLGR